MKLTLLLTLVLSCTFCEAQSVLTTPADQAQSVSASKPTNETDAAAVPNQAPRQPRGNTYNDNFAPGSGALVAPTPEPARAQTRIVGPINAKSDFEQFAEDATGRRLPVYGRQLFNEVPTTF